MFTASPSGPVWGVLFTVLLLTGCVTDVRARRIPNILVVAIVASGIGHSLATRPAAPAMLFSLAGLMLGFAIWIVFHMGGVVGAGDVKFFAAAGTWLGPSATWRAALIAGVVGGVLAVFFLIRERRALNAVRRLVVAARLGSLSLLEEKSGASEGSGARLQLPYGVALAAGALAAAWLPGLIR